MSSSLGTDETQLPLRDISLSNREILDVVRNDRKPESLVIRITSLSPKWFVLVYIWYHVFALKTDLFDQ